MPTFNEQSEPNEQANPRLDTNIHGNVQQLIQIAQVQGSINIFSQAVIDKLLEAIAAQGRPDNSLQMREAVAYTLALLRSKSVLYANLDNEIWKYVFKSLLELRDALAQARSKLYIDGPQSIKSLIDLMVVAIREYIEKYETNFTLFMEPEPFVYHQREWPELPYASRDLLSLRVLLIAAIAPLNTYAEEGQAVQWDQQDFWIRKYELAYAKLEPFDLTPSPTKDGGK
jgi:hypothetical protein